MDSDTPDYGYTYDNGGNDSAVWNNLLSGVLKGATDYGLASLGNRDRRNQMAVSPTAAAGTNNNLMKWAIVGGLVLVVGVVALLMLKKGGGK